MGWLHEQLNHLADWLVAIGTLALAVVTVYQDRLRARVQRPRMCASTNTAPPNCIALDATIVAQGNEHRLPVSHTIRAVYGRLWVHNEGNTTALSVEVYAQTLRRKRADGGWDEIKDFAPMNLTWSDVGGAYFPRISPGMGKHCDLLEVVDPGRLVELGIPRTKPGLDQNKTSLRVLLIAQPNHDGNIIGPGEYELLVIIAAENAEPVPIRVGITLTGAWFTDEDQMRRDGLGVRIASVESSSSR